MHASLSRDRARPAPTRLFALATALVLVLSARPAGAGTWQDMMWPFNAARTYVLGLWAGEEQQFESALAGFGTRLSADTTQLQELVREAGYEIVEIDVEASLLPAIALTLDFQRDITAAEEAALRAKLDRMDDVLGDIEAAIVSGLLDLDTTIEAVRPDGYTLSEVEIDVDLIPGFTLMFEPGGN